MKYYFNLVIILSVFLSCHNDRKEIRYNKFKQEIVKKSINEFEKNLPADFDQNLLANLKFAPYFESFGCSGIEVLYELDSIAFIENYQLMLKNSKLPLFELSDSNMQCDSSDTEKVYLFQNRAKIALPKMNEIFCNEDTCVHWNDVDLMISSYGKERLFSNEAELSKNSPQGKYNYSIGAFFSKESKCVIHWMMIYN